jgi:hypothetical protein
MSGTLSSGKTAEQEEQRTVGGLSGRPHVRRFHQSRSTVARSVATLADLLGDEV